MVVGQEADIHHLVLLNEEGVLQVVAIEGDGIVGDGGTEHELQQTALVVVDVHIREYILQCGGEDFASVHQFRHTFVAFSLDDLLL